MRRLEKYQGMSAQTIEDVEYADDACLIAECLLRITELLEAVSKEGEKFGLKINTAKTKIMTISKHETNQLAVKLGQEDIEIVRKFVYLGSELKADGGADTEIKRRIALAGTAFNKLQKIFKRHDIRLNVKLRIFNSCVIPVLTYGCESWDITKAMQNKLIAAENKWIRRILRISYREHVTNENIRQRTQQPLINNVIKRRRMKWAGHVLRMDETRNPKKILNYKPKGKRAPGRPKRRWRDGLEEDLKMAGVTIYGRTEGRERMTLVALASKHEE